MTSTDKHIASQIAYIKVTKSTEDGFKQERHFYAWTDAQVEEEHIRFTTMLPYNNHQAMDGYSFFEKNVAYALDLCTKEGESFTGETTKGDWLVDRCLLDIDRDDFTTISVRFVRTNPENEQRYDEQRAKFLETVLDRVEKTETQLLESEANIYKQQYWNALQERIKETSNKLKEAAPLLQKAREQTLELAKSIKESFQVKELNLERLSLLIQFKKSLVENPYSETLINEIALVQALITEEIENLYRG